MNAAFGAESGISVTVTHIGGSPNALLATQPAGKLGAVTPSKFSKYGVHAGEAVAVAVAVPVAVAVAVGVKVNVGDGLAVAVAVGVGVGPPAGPTRTK